jgi:hypothetical protein
MQAVIDQNSIKSRLAVLNTDGVTTVPIAIDESNGSMRVNTIDVVEVTLQPLSPRDENYHACMLFMGEDGLTYPWVADSEGRVLIEA